MIKQRCPFFPLIFLSYRGVWVSGLERERARESSERMCVCVCMWDNQNKVFHVYLWACLVRNWTVRHYLQSHSKRHHILIAWWRERPKKATVDICLHCRMRKGHFRQAIVGGSGSGLEAMLLKIVKDWCSFDLSVLLYNVNSVSWMEVTALI